MLLPIFLLLGAGGVAAYAGRAALIPAVAVRVAPAVTASSEGQQAAPESATPATTVLVQAPGWIEPDPFAVTIPALAEGVICEVRITEGQRVAADEVVARMINRDSTLALERADAELLERDADIARAEADYAAAQSRADELKDDLARKRPLVEKGAIGAAELAQLELRVTAAERMTTAAAAATRQAQAARAKAAVMQEEAKLLLDRMEIRSPSAGVVMRRLVEPGSRISMQTNSGEMATSIAKLYDPARLQVRVDVPIADAAKVGPGTKAEITTEALPNTVFHGQVSRVVHEANIQRNTVQFKVAVSEPVETLKPEMLTRVRFIGESRTQAAPGTASAEGSEGLVIPAAALVARTQDGAAVWLVDLRQDGPHAKRVQVTLRAGPAEANAVVTSGLHTGDRVVVEPPPELREGSRLNILGEAEER
ncbi:MAG: efflux RND transporter periplasmic adaptor subunit [Planctomycetes bacterium]|nr:efflux RND transporter periplasmic adaptor subunit [Planctomycetota bacterium]